MGKRNGQIVVAVIGEDAVAASQNAHIGLQIKRAYRLRFLRWYEKCAENILVVGAGHGIKTQFSSNNEII